MGWSSRRQTDGPAVPVDCQRDTSEHAARAHGTVGAGMCVAYLPLRWLAHVGAACGALLRALLRLYSPHVHVGLNWVVGGLFVQ